MSKRIECPRCGGWMDVPAFPGDGVYTRHVCDVPASERPQPKDWQETLAGEYGESGAATLDVVTLTASFLVGILGAVTFALAGMVALAVLCGAAAVLAGVAFLVLPGDTGVTVERRHGQRRRMERRTRWDAWRERRAVERGQIERGERGAPDHVGGGVWIGTPPSAPAIVGPAGEGCCHYCGAMLPDDVQEGERHASWCIDAN